MEIDVEVPPGPDGDAPVQDIGDVEMGAAEDILEDTIMFDPPADPPPAAPVPGPVPPPPPPQRLNPYEQFLKAENEKLRGQVSSLEAAVESLETEKTALSRIISDKSFTQESFENDNERVKFYTGVSSYTVLLMIFNLVSAFLPHGPNSKTSKWQEFIMVLMRMRLGLPIKLSTY